MYKMRTRLVGLCVFATIAAATALGQTPTDARVNTSSNLKLAYNASIIYPGFRGGIEYPVQQKDVTRYKRHGVIRHFTKMRFASAEIGYYHHPTFHDNIYLLLGWQMRKQRPRGFFTEFSPSLGYSRTFLGGETYLVDNTGKISLVKLAGYNYVIMGIGGGCGYRFRPDMSAYLRLSMLTMYPSNNIVYLRPTVDLGVIWQPKHFLPSRLKVVSISKGKKP